MRYPGRVGLQLRVPAWHTSVRLRVGGADRAPDSTDGYIAVDCAGETEIELDFGMRARFVWANERVWHDSGRKAVEYGPLVLCAESADNGPDLASVRIPDLKEAAIDRRDPFTLAVPAERLRTSPALYSYEAPGRRTVYAAAHPVLCLGQPRPRRYAGVVSVNRDGEIIPVVSVHSYG